MISLSIDKEYKNLISLIKSIENYDDLYILLEKQIELIMVADILLEGIKLCTQRINEIKGL